MHEPSGIPFGDYQLIKRIARGGMAEVFLGRQRGLEGFDRLVAVKRVLPHLVDSQDFIRMFFDEARLAANLSHPNCVHIYEFGKVEDHYFIAMEYVDGVNAGDLIHWAAHEPLPPVLVARIGADACAGLHYAHDLRDVSGRALRLVHRDVSPPNLLLSYDGTIKLVDFGIAKAVNCVEQTRPGVVKGKYAYMSPEQTTGQPLDGKSDVFSLGLVLWEMLAGATAVTRADQVAAMKSIRDGRLKPIREARPDVPRKLARALGRALAVSRDERMSAMELGLALEEFIKGSPELGSSLHIAQWLRTRFPRQNPTGEIASLEGEPGGTRPATMAATRATDAAGEARELPQRRRSPDDLAATVQVAEGFLDLGPLLDSDATEIDPLSETPMPSEPPEPPEPPASGDRLPLLGRAPSADLLADALAARARARARSAGRGSGSQAEDPLGDFTRADAATLPDDDAQTQVASPRTLDAASVPDPMLTQMASSVPTATSLVRTGRMRRIGIATIATIALGALLLAISSRGPELADHESGPAPAGVANVDEPATPVGATDDRTPEVEGLTEAALAQADAGPEPEPAPALAMIEVLTDPSGAEVALGGGAPMEAPILFADVEPGTHSIVISRPGFRTVRREVRVSSGQRFTLDIRLDPIPAVAERKSSGQPERGLRQPPRERPGTLTVRTRPWSEVHFRGQKLGVTPLANVRLPPGRHTLTFRNPTYPPQRRTVVIRSGQTTKISFDLTE